MKLTCIMCPVGCQLEVTKNNDEFIVTGNGCIRGKRYAETEMTNPVRMITSLVKTKENKIISVKTSDVVPKDKIFDVLEEIAKLRPFSPKNGDIIAENIAGLNGVNVIVTRE